MKHKTNHSWSINDCGDVISIETFISCPVALSIEEQYALMELEALMTRLQQQASVESLDSH